MDILLIQPPVRDFYMTPQRTEPLGLEYIAASLKRHGHRVEIFDCLTDKKKSIPIPDELAYLKEYYPFDDRGPFKLYTGYYHFGMTYDDIAAAINRSQAQLYGISSNFTPYFYESLEIAKIIKRLRPGIPVVMGGCHVSCDPEGVMQHPEVDYIVLGEGEERLPKLLDCLASGKGLDDIDGIGYRSDGRVVIRPMKEMIHDLDAVAVPERSGYAGKDKKRRSLMLITSRGCPHACEYCSARKVMGSRFRARSVESVLREMKESFDAYGVRSFDFEDDNFTLGRTRALELMKGVIDTFGEGGIELSAMNGISFAALDKELLSLMKRAGFKAVNLSFVSTEELTKTRMKRPQPVEDFDSIVAEAVSLGLRVIAYGIFGMPGQTISEMLDTVIHLMGLPVLMGPSFYYPSPGTPLFSLCDKKGYLPPHQQQWRSSAFPVETENFSRLDLVTIFRISRLVNYIKLLITKGEFLSGVTIVEIAASLEERFNGEKKIPMVPEALLYLLFQSRALYKLVGKNKSIMALEPLSFSSRVVDHFINNAWGKPVY